jgi:hypothetical protein
MGKYLNEDLYGRPINIHSKAMALLNSGAEEISKPETFDQYADEGKAIICVVDNGPFQAAAYAYCQRELEAFQYSGDSRPKMWLKADKEIVEKYAQ